MLISQNISETIARIERWYTSLSEPRPQCLPCSDLCTALNTSMRALHLPLLILGWERRPVWSRVPKTGRRVLRVNVGSPWVPGAWATEGSAAD